jgi:hypothetical protein
MLKFVHKKLEQSTDMARPSPPPYDYPMYGYKDFLSAFSVEAKILRFCHFDFFFIHFCP